MNNFPLPNDGAKWESFRDPDGWVSLALDGDILRHLDEEGVAKYLEIKKLKSIQKYQQVGMWVQGTLGVLNGKACVAHPRVFLPTYPHEWSAGMLYEAAKLTLEINISLLAEDWELKDATPRNILFDGVTPIFVDHLSPIKRPPGQPGWVAYGQFIRTFLIPLILNQLEGIPLPWIYLAQRDGVSPDMALPMLGWGTRCHPRIFELVILPILLNSNIIRNMLPKKITLESQDTANLVTYKIIHKLQKHLDWLKPRHSGPSIWLEYQEHELSYTAEGQNVKDRWVKENIQSLRPSTILDLGCNTGNFSKIAASFGARVVALDSDPECIDKIFREASSERLSIQPLCVNLGRPSPRMGWDYKEDYSLLDRIGSRFEMTLSFALIHHMLITERVPMRRLALFLAKISLTYSLTEWIPHEDPYFQVLAGPNIHLYESITLENWLLELGYWFDLVSILNIPGGSRSLLLLKRNNVMVT